MKKKMTRRRALSTGAKLGGAVVATAIVAGVAGYYGGTLAAPAASTVTQTVTQTALQTQTVTTGPASTSASSASTTSSSAASTPYNNYPPYVASWPLDLRVSNPVSGLTGSVKSVMFNTIPYQSDTTIPNSRASGVLAGLQSVYPNVTWSNYNPGGLGGSTGVSEVQTVLQAGGYQWDVCRGTLPDWIPQGWLQPLTDYWNAWPDHTQFDPNDMALATYNGDVYMLPDTADIHSGWWRKDLFAEAGFGTFDPKTFEYTGTTPEQMDYNELTQAFAAITKAGSSRGVYASYICNDNSAIIGSWFVDAFLKANGAQRYYGDLSSCTICLDQAPYKNAALDVLTFFQNNAPNFKPGGPAEDINALITDLESGSVAWFYGLDSNLDGQYAAVPLSKVNPNIPSTSTATLRNAIQPTVGWADGTKPVFPSAINNNIYIGVLKGSTNLAADWEWIRAMASFNSQVAFWSNLSGVPSRLDVKAMSAADPFSDIADWSKAQGGNIYTDSPANSSFGGLLATAYQNSFDPFFAGTGTPEQCIENFVNAATTALQKANIPASTVPAPTPLS